MFADTTPTLKRKTSPVSKEMDEKEVKEFLNRIPDLNKLFKTTSSAEIKQMLNIFLNPKEEATASDSNGTEESNDNEQTEQSAVDKALDELSVGN